MDIQYKFKIISISEKYNVGYIQPVSAIGKFGMLFL